MNIVHQCTPLLLTAAQPLKPCPSLHAAHLLLLFSPLSSQGSSSEAHCRDSSLCELAGPSRGANPRGGLSDQPLVSDGLPVAPGSCHSFIKGRPAVESAHRENAVAQEAGAGLWRSPALARWVTYMNIFELFEKNNKFSIQTAASS